MHELSVEAMADMQASELVDSDEPNDLNWLISRLQKIRLEHGGKLKVACTVGVLGENVGIEDKHLRYCGDGDLTSAYDIVEPFLLIGGPDD